MKNFLLTFLLSFFITSVDSQVERGRVLVGGGFNYNNQTMHHRDTLGSIFQHQYHTNLNCNLRVGLFVANNFLFGVLAGGGTGNSKLQRDNFFGSGSGQSISITKSNSFTFGIFARAYKKVGNSRFAIFCQGGLSYTQGKSSTENQFISSPLPPTINKFSADETTLSMLLQPGVTCFVTNRFAVETYFGNFGYSMSSTKNYDKDGRFLHENSASGFSTGIGLNLLTVWLGINFYLGGSGADQKVSGNSVE